MAGTTHGSGAMVIPETIDFLALHHLHWAAGISGGHRSRLDVLRSRSVCDGSLRHGVRRRLLVLLVLVACHALLLPQLWRLRSSRNKTGASFKRPPSSTAAVGLAEASAALEHIHSQPHSPHQRTLHSSSRRSPGLNLPDVRMQLPTLRLQKSTSYSPPPVRCFFQVAPRSNESTESRGGESCWRR